MHVYILYIVIYIYDVLYYVSARSFDVFEHPCALVIL